MTSNSEATSSLNDSETIANLRRSVELLEARVAKLEGPPPQWVPLKLAAGIVGYGYEALRKRAARGDIEAQRRGGRWYANLASLKQRFLRSPQ